MMLGLAALLFVTQSPSLDSADFSTTIDNPFMPMPVGVTYFYDGFTDKDPTTDQVRITSNTKLIAGVRTRIVSDNQYVNGILEERTSDYFAQDTAGNVWYFGEKTAELDANGNVTSTEGSWLAGVNGALPGIVMEAHPQNGDLYQQEFASGVAQDMAKIIDVSINKTITVPYGSFANCLETEEFSPLEPKVLEDKFYARGIGFVRSVMKQGGNETLELVAIENPVAAP